MGQLAAAHQGDPSTRIVEEMGIWGGTVRVDLAVINGEMVAYELKSNADTLDRLPYQIEIYSKVFDRVTLVVGDRLAEKAIRVIPSWWGCTVAKMRDERVVLKRKRGGRRNPQQDRIVFVQMLWKDEAISLLEKHGLADGWRSKPAGKITERLLSVLPFDLVAEGVRDALKTRHKLGQLVPSQFDMPIDTIPNPTSRAAG